MSEAEDFDIIFGDPEPPVAARLNLSSNIAEIKPTVAGYGSWIQEGNVDEPAKGPLATTAATTPTAATTTPPTTAPTTTTKLGDRKVDGVKAEDPEVILTRIIASRKPMLPSNPPKLNGLPDSPERKRPSSKRPVKSNVDPPISTALPTASAGKGLLATQFASNQSFTNHPTKRPLDSLPATNAPEREPKRPVRGLDRLAVLPKVAAEQFDKVPISPPPPGLQKNTVPTILSSFAPPKIGPAAATSPIATAETTLTTTATTSVTNTAPEAIPLSIGPMTEAVLGLSPKEYQSQVYFHHGPIMFVHRSYGIFYEHAQTERQNGDVLPTTSVAMNPILRSNRLIHYVRAILWYAQANIQFEMYGDGPLEKWRAYISYIEQVEKTCSTETRDDLVAICNLILAWTIERVLGLLGKELQKLATPMLEAAVTKTPQLVNVSVITIINQLNLYQEQARQAWTKGSSLFPSLFYEQKLSLYSSIDEIVKVIGKLLK